MIRRFHHKGLERLFLSGDSSGINPQFASKLQRILTLLNRAATVAELDLPGFRLHQLKGRGKGTWSMRVSGNWRITFEFDGIDVTKVDLVDYH